MNMAKKEHKIFTASGLFSFSIGLVAVLFIVIFRTITIRNTILAELGSGYISLTAPAINGVDPPIFYRVMHNLTAIWSLVFYFLLMTLAVFLTARTSWRLQSVRLCHAVIATVHVVFVVLFYISLCLPVGDPVTVLGE
jgi:hypothetical protein